jgi:hypothetical protein
VCLAAHVVQSNHAEIPLKLTNKQNVTKVLLGGGGGSVWANNGRTVYPAASFAHLLPGDGKIQSSGSKVLMVGLQRQWREISSL